MAKNSSTSHHIADFHTTKKRVPPHNEWKAAVVSPKKIKNKKITQKPNNIMIIVPVKEGENIERALKKFKRKYEKTGIVKELRARQAFQKPSVINRKKMMKAVYVQHLRDAEE